MLLHRYALLGSRTVPRADRCLAYNHFAAKYSALALPFVGACEMSDVAGAYGCALLTSFLGLFINFYIQTYTRSKAKSKTAVAAAKPANNTADSNSTSGSGAAPPSVKSNGNGLHAPVPVPSAHAQADTIVTESVEGGRTSAAAPSV